MISRSESMASDSRSVNGDAWSKLAAPVPASAIAWRQDGRIITREGKPFARFVAYIEATTVRERLDAVVPGEWDLTLDLLPPTMVDGDGVEDKTPYAFKARLQILGVVREDVGVGKDYKQASTDAFKRAAVRFGIGHELYAYESNWVLMDGDDKHAKPVEDPNLTYERRYSKKSVAMPKAGPVGAALEGMPKSFPPPEADRAAKALDAELVDVSCPKCKGPMWDNRATKKNPKAPDFKCRDRSCDGVVWPPKEGAKGQGPVLVKAGRETADDDFDGFPSALHDEDDDLPF